MVAFYPLHNLKERAALSEKWVGKCILPWNQPLDMIKEYLGEKIGLYFAFLAHYTSWLGILGVLGATQSCRQQLPPHRKSKRTNTEQHNT